MNYEREFQTTLEQNAMFYSQIYHLLKELINEPAPDDFLDSIRNVIRDLTGGDVALLTKNESGYWIKFSSSSGSDRGEWDFVLASNVDLYEEVISSDGITFSKNYAEVNNLPKSLSYHSLLNEYSNFILMPIAGPNPLLLGVSDLSIPQNIPRYLSELKMFVIPLSLSIQQTLMVAKLTYSQKLQEEYQKELEVLLSLLRHDLNNDLGVITMNLELARSMIDEDNSELHDMISMIEAVSERMMGLIKSTTISSKGIEDNPVLLIQKITDLTKRAHTKTKIHIELGEATENLRIAKSRLLPIVFDNLFRNAISFGGESPVINVKLQKIDANVEFIISDNGPGVSPEIRDRLFQRGVSTRGGGSGLYLSKKIIESMNGTIELSASDSATFVIRLPLQ